MRTAEIIIFRYAYGGTGRIGIEAFRENMIPTYLINLSLNAVRFFAGFILMALSFRAFLKSRTSAMLFLTCGFTLLTLGDLLSAIYYIDNLQMYKMVSQTFDILGLVALIIAVEKVT